MSQTRSQVRAFISYSHDSDEHRRCVLGLANRLRNEGVDARLDKYIDSPPEGWPQWMYNEMEAAEFVLVVCTATYELRALGREEPRRGLGAAWEGAIITQAIYDAPGAERLRKFIPVVFDESNTRHIPYFLRGATYHDLGTEAGYEALHRHLTGQHATPMPPLGAVKSRPVQSGAIARQERPVPPKASASPVKAHPAGRRVQGNLAVPAPARGPRRVSAEEGEPLLVHFADGTLELFSATKILSGDEIALTLSGIDPRAAARLQPMLGGPGRGQTLGIAFGLRAYWVRVVDVRHEVTGRMNAWHLTLRPEDRLSGVMDEISTTGYSADDIAILRARRILLDELLPGRPPFLSRSSGWTGGAEGFLDAFVRGHGAIQVERSPLPLLHRGWSAERSAFVSAARLAAALWLTLTNTVATITQLDVTLKASKNRPELRVRFEGTRRKIYSNVAATVIKVEGTCPLSPR